MMRRILNILLNLFLLSLAQKAAARALQKIDLGRLSKLPTSVAGLVHYDNLLPLIDVGALLKSFLVTLWPP